MNGEGKVDPITLIVTALVAGAALGAQDTMSVMVKDAYVGCKALVKKRLGGRPGAELVLAEHEQAPETLTGSSRLSIWLSSWEGTATSSWANPLSSLSPHGARRDAGRERATPMATTGSRNVGASRQAPGPSLAGPILHPSL